MVFTFKSHCGCGWPSHLNRFNLNVIMLLQQHFVDFIAIVVCFHIQIAEDGMWERGGEVIACVMCSSG